ncbi:MAG TPA: hypothetical protein VM219_07305 [Phycisphaerae bacterium]|nr:hypothetical protein [Phycisphaerae bacterium]
MKGGDVVRVGMMVVVVLSAAAPVWAAAAGGRREFTAPFGGDAVLYLGPAEPRQGRK